MEIIEIARNYWPEITGILIIILEQILPKTGLVEANSTTELVVNLVKKLLTRNAVGLVLLFIFLSGCQTINLSTNAGERNTVKANDNDTPNTSTSAAIPVSVGAQPNSTGTVNR